MTFPLFCSLSFGMVEEENIEEILNLSNGDVMTNCNVLQSAFDSENYDDLFCPFETPPNKYACIDPHPSEAEETLSRQPAIDPLGFPEGSPVTPQLHESSMVLSEIDFEDQPHISPFGCRILHGRHESENQVRQGLLGENTPTICQKEKKAQLREGVDNDFQELLELGRAMNLPSRPDMSSATFLHFDESSPRKQRETSDNFSLLPFPLEQVITTLEREETTDGQDFPKLCNSSPNLGMPNGYPDSSSIDKKAQIGAANDTIVSKQSENAIRVSIDDILQQVASRNLNRCAKRPESSKETGENDSTSEPAFKKRKTTFCAAESQQGAEDNSGLKRSAGKGKGSSKKGVGCDRSGAATSGKAISSGGSTPSRFCHICTRAAKPDVVLVCGNVGRGTCRKVICFKCIRDMSWDWGSLHGTEPWTCTHCREVSILYYALSH